VLASDKEKIATTPIRSLQIHSNFAKSMVSLESINKGRLIDIQVASDAALPVAIEQAKSRRVKDLAAN
jgi:hypothetical protein